MSLKLLAPGTHSLLVDAGRPRTRGLGVPVGGPADRTSFLLGNALLGNPPDAPALEITLSGPTLLALDDVGACVFGAPFHVECEGKPIEPNHTFTLRKGHTLHIGGTPEGCRAYLCVIGGFRTKAVLGSVTGFEPLKGGGILECVESFVSRRSAIIPSPRLCGGRAQWGETLAGSGRSFLSPRASATHSALPPQSRGEGKTSERSPQQLAGLRTLPGPQADWFDDSFYSYTYRVTPASNRMGIRLDGSTLKLPNRELVSEPVAPGAVQITNDGKPIVLGVDGQTIGGYPKIAHVISADLDALGQLRPGDEVGFERVSEREAESAATEMRKALRLLLRRIAVAVS